MNDDKERKNSEKDFHNKRFGAEVDPRLKLLKYYELTSEAESKYKLHILNNLNISSNVLEYGCGSADDVDFFKKLNCHLYGIDISEEAIEKARAMAKSQNLDAIYKVSDAEATHFEDKFFDKIFGSGIIHHLNTEYSMKELHRIVKTDGECIFFEPLGKNPFINIFRKMTPAMRTPDEHPLTSADFAIMKKYFDNVELEYFYFFAIVAVLFRKTGWYLRVKKIGMAVDKGLGKMFGRYGEYCWLVVIKLSAPVKM